MDNTASSSSTHLTEVETPLIDSYVNGAVDYKGREVLRSKSGFWRSAYFIISVEVAERFAYYGVSSNLITYLTGSLGLSTATAAENVNAWTGTASLLPLVGAFIADAFLGRYLTIIFASLLYILALGLLALSTLLPYDCENVVGASSCSSHVQVTMFFVSLYLVAFAQGGHKPCVQAFGADQFDANDPAECRAKSSFFNWWYFGLCAGPTVGIFVLTYIQDNLSWGLGFGIPCIVMGLALLIFLLGTMTYRFAEKVEDKSAFVRIGQVFVEAARNLRSTRSDMFVEKDAYGVLPRQPSQQFSVNEVEEAKAGLRLAPIWASCLAYATVFSQTSTLFTKQGATMDRLIGSSFEIPAATLQSFIGLSIITLIPIYDTILVPLARTITKKPSGITMLQRIGTGIFISIILMVVSALVETKRLKTAREYGLLDDPVATVPIKIWWLLPQYVLAGASEVFTVVGMQEFFYDQVPSELRSVGLALYLSAMGIGNFLSSFLISIVEKTTGGNGEDGWISDNINRGHVDYFYYLLAGISAVAFVMYVYAAKCYVYNQGRGF
ncbi:protein NRT1/ PTR FAMILY 5.10-like isoform X2 [Rutidosis leptorrhynchoides]|uniref:protein NRT1/ PTR FAMILY 5.10-like isoform X2 n=1 Tax=Rutidosis leptorrhynchoides TaxID=125765 RepID=UPI003A99CD00